MGFPSVPGPGRPTPMHSGSHVKDSTPRGAAPPDLSQQTQSHSVLSFTTRVTQKTEHGKQRFPLQMMDPFNFAA